MPSEFEDPISGLSPHSLLAGGLRGGDLSGEQFGCYCLIEPIGEGGMGVVYLAEQLEPVERAVALKVIKRGMDTDQMIARFGLERQTLASLEHPNIARVFDAGATPDGRPFFVMELVEGVPITLFCKREGLGVRNRLRLVLQACEAVAHAHRHGVIHRDLKPGNLMVSGSVPGELKVIDFGIAKVARPDSGVDMTLVGQVVGTPEYMCPEQASGGEVDTRADVFSLGAVLAELLPPAGGSGNELLWIVLRATAEDREQRYGSVAELAADLGRYLENRPVLARRPSRIYRLRKLVRRNRGVIAAGVLLLIAGLFGLGKMLEARSLRHDAERAHHEGQKAAVVTVFVQELLEAMREPDEARRRGAMLTAVRYFDEHLAKADDARPEVAFLRQQMLGNAYHSLREFEESEKALMEARHLATMFPFPDEDLPLLVSVETLLGDVFIHSGRLDEAVDVAQRLVGQHGILPSAELGNYFMVLGRVLCEANRHQEAEIVLLEAQTIELELAGEGSERWLHATAWVAHALAQLGREDEAIRVLKNALEIGQKRAGDGDNAELFGIREDLKRLSEKDL